MLQYVAVCCSVLQCVAVYCRVLPCVAVCCSVLQCVAVCVTRLAPCNSELRTRNTNKSISDRLSASVVSKICRSLQASTISAHDSAVSSALYEYIRMCTCIPIYRYQHMTLLCPAISMNIHVCTHAYPYINVCMYIYIFIYIYIYIYTYTYIYICIYVYILIYIHTHTHTCIHHKNTYKISMRFGCVMCSTYIYTYTYILDQNTRWNINTFTRVYMTHPHRYIRTQLGCVLRSTCIHTYVHKYIWQNTR